MEKNEAFIVLVFPELTPNEPSEKRLPKLATALMQCLTESSATPPQNVHSNKDKLCMLVLGDFDRITMALSDGLTNDCRWVVLRVGSPCAEFGLATARGWVRRHSS
jgi:hypothetical protein